jgi:hypothetical protein
MVNKENRIVLVPKFQSFADPMLLTFIHNHFGMEMPFLFGNAEDIPNIPLVDKGSKLFGYVHARRSREQSAQSEYINSQMLH